MKYCNITLFRYTLQISFKDGLCNVFLFSSHLAFFIQFSRYDFLNFLLKFKVQHLTVVKYWSSNFNIFIFLLILFQTRNDTQHYTFVYASVSDEVWSKIWWAQVDSNHRPHAYQACALTTWAMSPYLVEISGIEPLTPCLQSRCSPSWAIPPYLLEPL